MARTAAAPASLVISLAWRFFRGRGNRLLDGTARAALIGTTLGVTAMVIAHNVRKWVSKSDACFIAATTHDDLLESLAPDVLIEKHLGERMDVREKSAG